MNTYHLNETAKFWGLARCCSDSLDNAIRNRKHFTDIGDLNYLMYQSMMHPSLTPSNSLRTSLLVVFRDTMLDNLTDLTDALGVDDYVGCSSIHGIGPSLAVFDSICNGQLHFANVYPSPLHSHSQMQIFVNTMMDNLVKFNP
jgi:tRNA A-37 threonylcarbamoyl transferase component Bud32